VKPDLGIHLNRSNAIMEAGYSITSRLTVRGIGTLQRTQAVYAGFLLISAPMKLWSRTTIG
jgi:hypothetical protein